MMAPPTWIWRSKCILQPKKHSAPRESAIMPPHRTGVNIPAFRLPPSRPLLGEEKVVVAAGRTHPRLARAAAPATRPQQTKFYPYVGKGGRRPIRGFAGTSTSSPLGASAPSSPFGRGGGWGEVRALSAPLAYLPSPPAPLPAGEGNIAALQGSNGKPFGACLLISYASHRCLRLMGKSKLPEGEGETGLDCRGERTTCMDVLQTA